MITPILSSFKSKTLYFELPALITYGGINYKMTSPANLIARLNSEGKSLSSVFDFRLYIKYCDLSTLTIHRKKIQVSLKPEEVEKLNLARKVRRSEELFIRNLTAVCSICIATYPKENNKKGTCSDSCYATYCRQKNALISKTHWCKSDQALEIRNRRVQTRIENNKKFSRVIIPWNKGKTGIYSPDTIRKISNAAIKQFQEQGFRKTGIEHLYEQLLIEEKIPYIYSMIIDRRQFDFYLKECNTIIEIQGDFWHANPKFYGDDKKPLREHQKTKILDDVTKKKLIFDKGMRFLEFWEDDIHNNWEYVVAETRRACI